MTGVSMHVDPIDDGLVGTPSWLEAGDDSIYAVLHHDSTAPRRGQAVLMISPFGWEEMESHRARRDVAIELARRGYVSARFDLPGTGDSSRYPRDVDLLDRWVDSIAAAAAWLSHTAKARRTVALGFGLGGLLATESMSRGAAVDDLILWGTHPRGRQHLREMMAYARLTASPYEDEQPEIDPDGASSIGGFVLSEATARGISSLDMEAMHLSGPDRRTLLIGRDASGPGKQLETVMTAAGHTVEAAGSVEYVELMANPQSPTLRRPTATMTRIVGWLEAGEISLPPSRTPLAVPGPVSRTRTVLRAESPVVTESVFTLTADGTTVPAILTERDGVDRRDVGVLLLNSGALRKTGPLRASVEIARRWAARGIPCVRVDIPGVGDAGSIDLIGADERPLVLPGSLMSASRVNATAATVRDLVDRGIAERFILVGHCSGAYVGFHAALLEPTVIATFGVNHPSFMYDEGAFQALMRNRIRSALRHGLMRRLRDEGIRPEEIRQTVTALLYGLKNRHAEKETDEDDATVIAQLFDRLTEQGVQALVLQGRAEASYQLIFSPEFQSLTDRWPGIQLQELPTRDHMVANPHFQRFVHDCLDRALDQVLGGIPLARCGDI